MKKIAIHKVSILLILIFAIGQIQASPKRKKGDYNRTFSQSYSINADATLTLDNDFTDVEIINWDKNEISIDVEVNVNAKSEKEAEKWFNKILVEITGNSNAVNLKTHLKKGNSNTCNDEHWFVIATIHAPASINLDAEMEFGSLTADIIAGKCTFDIEFGNVDANGFPNDRNEIDIEYGNFTTGILGCDNASVEFGGLEIGVLTSSCEINSEFSGVEIDMVANPCKNLDINVEFGSLDLVLPKNGSFNIEASSSFGDIDLDDDLQIVDKDKGMFDLSYEARLGAGNGKITISSSYSDVEIKTKNVN